MGDSTGFLRIPNIERLEDFDVAWPVDRRLLSAGMTGVLRVRNEQQNLPWSLPGLLRACDRVVLVDNQSDDDTVGAAWRVAAAAGLADRLEVVAYPHAVSRCGADHLATNPRSVHSLAHFYNWAFSKVRTTYSLKWDGDMVLTPEGIRLVADLSWQLQGVEAVVRMHRHPLYVESERVGYLDTGTWDNEEYAYPMGTRWLHHKAFDWELRLSPQSTPTMGLPQGICLEIKHLAGDEFGHWTEPGRFRAQRNRRKAREWEVFHALCAGVVPEGVVRVESPDTRHVVEFVAEEWLPAVPRPIARPPG